MMKRLPALAAMLFAIGISLNSQEPFTFQCVNLPQAGIELVPVSSPDYAPLFTDIQQRMDHLPAGPPIMPEQLRRMMFGKFSAYKGSTSAILLNKSNKSIAALALVWRYEDVDGRTYGHNSTMPFGKTVLLPFSTSAQSLKLQTYWNTILPGSKRYISEDGMAGDNTDVRMPIGDEIWSGGGGFGGGSGMGGRAAAVKSVTMSIDGVFFADGEFMGDDKLGLWESITGEAQARMDVAKIARDGKAHGTAAADILSQIDQVTGPPTGRPPTAGRGLQVKNASVERAQQLLANEIDRMRKSRGDEYTVDTLAAQADTKLPEFRKL